MGSSRLPDRLTSLQRDLLAAFFERTTLSLWSTRGR